MNRVKYGRESKVAESRVAERECFLRAAENCTTYSRATECEDLLGAVEQRKVWSRKAVRNKSN